MHILDRMWSGTIHNRNRPYIPYHCDFYGWYWIPTDNGNDIYLRKHPYVVDTYWLNPKSQSNSRGSFFILAIFWLVKLPHIEGAIN